MLIWTDADCVLVLKCLKDSSLSSNSETFGCLGLAFIFRCPTTTLLGIHLTPLLFGNPRPSQITHCIAKMPASTHQRQPKLRDSCDHCSNSKVRCDSRSDQLSQTNNADLSPEAKPSCARCREKGFQCEYSPARRIGRVRSKTLKSISDDVKFRLPKGDVHSASSSLATPK